jgi:FixJ family two-component response regulator
VNLTPAVELRVRAAILAGASDEEIAAALGVSVKVVRPIRLAVEAERRPRTPGL